MRRVSAFPGHQGLQDFRQANPKASWDDFKDDPTFGELQLKLAEHHGWCCSYCEIRLSRTPDTHHILVEHYIPKGTSNRDEKHNWHLDDQNLLACCLGGTRHYLPAPLSSDTPSFKENHSCDQVKLGDSPVGRMIDPRELPLTPIFVVESSGQIRVDVKTCRTTEVDPLMARDTLVFLNLNCTRLKEARRTVFNETVDRMIDDAEKAQGMDQDSLLSALRAAVAQPDGLGRPADFITTRLSCFDAHVMQALS